jgi:hypothetical protein
VLHEALGRGGREVSSSIRALVGDSLDEAWRTVAQGPDETQRLEVLADLLMEHAHPLGDFIRLSLEAERTGTKIDLPAAWSMALRGQAIPFTAERWRRGFLVEATAGDSDELQRLLGAVAARLLRTLRVTFEDGVRADRVDGLIERLPITLESLSLSCPEGARLSGTLSALTPTLSLLPKVRSLTLQRVPGSLARLNASRVEYLWYSPAGPNVDDELEGFSRAQLGGLKWLELGLTSSPSPWPAALLAGHGLPALKSLRLTGTLWPHHLEELTNSGLLRRLEALDLAVQHLPQFDALFDEQFERFEHLRSLGKPRPYALL